MKKGLIIAGVLVVIAIGLLWGNLTGKSTLSYTCNDNDGDDIYTKGTIIFSTDSGKTTTTRVDECSTSGLAEVREYTCTKSGKVEQEWKSCGENYKCVEGACIPA